MGLCDPVVSVGDPTSKAKQRLIIDPEIAGGLRLLSYMYAKLCIPEHSR